MTQLCGPLLEESPLDEPLLELPDEPLLDEEEPLLELPEELLDELLLKEEEPDDEELDDELDELDDDPLLELPLEELELDDPDELGGWQQPSPSCTTSHFWLSASHLAQP